MSDIMPINYDDIRAYLADLDTDTLYMQAEAQTAASFLDGHELAADMRAHYEVALYALASRRGMELARQARAEEKPEVVHKGLGIAAVFGAARRNSIEIVGKGGTVRLDRIGLSCAHTNPEEFRALSNYSLRAA